MNDKKWVSTKDLVGKTFTINDVGKRGYRQWDNVARKFNFSDTPKAGYNKFWNIELDDGTWSASSAQYSQLLIEAEDRGMADVLGKRFACISNNKEGTELRYFFNLIKN